MGVPAFFKWLTLRYPKIVMDAIEEVNTEFDINDYLQTKYNADSSMPYIDNFYLDMNGIIHPCCHPQDKPQPSTEEEMFNNVFEYTDKLIKIIKPKKLIYFAVDGVAPRAKMNQQRSRRFRAAQEAKEKMIKEKELLKEWKSKGLKAPELEPQGFDSNVITPGTQFMDRLSQALKIYIADRLQNDNLWKGLTVIYSDSNVPGEGEHKILEFVRAQRLQNHYNPNTKHCIYGADADLIMLSLITHEPHFFIIRESLNENMWKNCDYCGQKGHIREECKKLINPEYDDNKNFSDDLEFSLIKVHIVREYLELEFKSLNLPFEIDPKLKFERFIDDFVFLCFFVGNDFIPHLPSLKIREGAIDALIYLYKKVIPTMDGFLTEGNGTINLARTQKLLEKLTLVEDEIFKKQLFAKNKDLQRQLQRERQEGVLDKNKIEDKIVKEYFDLKTNKEVELSNKEEIQLFDDILDDIEKIVEIEDVNSKKHILSQDPEGHFKRVLKEVLKKDGNKKMEQYKDPVRLGEVGWKARYYIDKFKVSTDDYEFKQLIKKSYIEGICWVFAYYYNGCISWEWYYPFHYAPFASDLCDIKDLDINFNIGVPFEPVEQLLSVLPPYSSKALPKCLRPLMHDPESELADFYPETTKLDINGQAFAWMGVNLIPFINEHRIRKSVNKRRKEFTEDENRRNRFGETLIYFNFKEHFIYTNVVGDNYYLGGYYTYLATPSFRTLAGRLKALESAHRIGKTMRLQMRGLNISEVKNCNVSFMAFENPEKQPHIGKLNKGIILPPKVIIEDNLDMYPKKSFKGEEVINLVKRILGYEDEIEQNVRSGIFDYSYNNNRAIEYNPNDLEVLRKKRYQRNEEYENRGMNKYERKRQTQTDYSLTIRREDKFYDKQRNFKRFDKNDRQDFNPNRNMQYRNQYQSSYQEPINSNIPSNFTNPNSNINQLNNSNLRANISKFNNLTTPKTDNNLSANDERNQSLNNLIKAYQIYMGKEKNNN